MTNTPDGSVQHHYSVASSKTIESAVSAPVYTNQEPGGILSFEDMVDSALRINDNTDNILSGPSKAPMNDNDRGKSFDANDITTYTQMEKADDANELTYIAGPGDETGFELVEGKSGVMDDTAFNII